MSTTGKAAANAPTVAELFEHAERTAPASEGFLTAPERHQLVAGGTPFYIGAVELRDGNYGPEVVYSIYIDPKDGDVPEPRKLSLKSNPTRDNFARLVNDALRTSSTALGPFYLNQLPGSGDRSGRYELGQQPQNVRQSAVQRFDPDAQLRPFK